MGPTGAPSWCRGLLPVLLLILLLHAHMSCITLASGRGIRCRGPQGSQQSRQQRQQPSNGGGFPTVAAWRVLLWHRPCQPPQQQQQQRSLQETGDVAFISSWGSRAACPSGASGRLSSAATLSSAAAAAVPVTAAAAVADAAAASAQQAAIAAAAATSLLFRRPPARHMEDAWQRWGPRKAAAALVGHAVGAPRTAGEAAPAARGAAPAATAAAGVAARPSTVGAYGSRKYRLVLLMSGELSVTDTQTIVRNYYLQLLRLKAAGVRVFYRGLRGLGSMIAKQDTAHFVEILFEAFPSALLSMRLRLQQDANVLRFMLLNLEKLGRPLEKDKDLSEGPPNLKL